MWVLLTDILVGRKQRKRLDRAKVEQHRATFEQGGYVLPIDVRPAGNGCYQIAGNGRHRYFGAVAAGMTHIEVTVARR